MLVGPIHHHQQAECSTIYRYQQTNRVELYQQQLHDSKNPPATSLWDSSHPGHDCAYSIVSSNEHVSKIFNEITWNDNFK